MQLLIVATRLKIDFSSILTVLVIQTFIFSMYYAMLVV